MEQIIQELKEHLITELNLEDLTPEDIDALKDALIMATQKLRRSVK